QGRWNTRPTQARLAPVHGRGAVDLPAAVKKPDNPVRADVLRRARHTRPVRPLEVALHPRLLPDPRQLDQHPGWTPVPDVPGPRRPFELAPRPRGSMQLWS